jgi:hypothetical protein
VRHYTLLFVIFLEYVNASLKTRLFNAVRKCFAEYFAKIKIRTVTDLTSIRPNKQQPHHSQKKWRKLTAPCVTRQPYGSPKTQERRFSEIKKKRHE